MVIVKTADFSDGKIIKALDFDGFTLSLFFIIQVNILAISAVASAQSLGIIRIQFGKSFI